MSSEFVASDATLLDLLRKQNALTVTELARELDVTATAVRQRLTRLMAQGYVERNTTREGRGRPSHHYRLTQQGRRKSGANFADLAMVLWDEIRQVKQVEVRRGLLERLAGRLAEQYAGDVSGDSLAEKMESVAELFRKRNIPFEVDTSGELPVLTALACPYPDLAEQDRGVCSMEKLLFAELLGEKIQLSGCRLDGQECCTFEAKPANSQAIA